MKLCDSKNGNPSAGLFKLILDVVGENATTAQVRNRKDEIMAYAVKIMNGI